MSDCSALKDFAVSDPCDNPDGVDEDGYYNDCDDTDDPEIYPNPPDDDVDEPDSQIQDSGTSNNIEPPTTPSSETEPTHIMVKPVNPTNPDNKDNGGNTDYLTAEHDDGNSIKATYILVALSSVILAILCN